MTVFVRGLEFYAYHGVPDAEQEIGHRYRVDVEYEVADQSILDDFASVVDYGAVGREVVAFCGGRKARTLEWLADALAAHILTQFSQIQSIKVSLEKRLPPTALIADSVGVVVVRGR
jgi:dihydroneopterin aldolase